MVIMSIYGNKSLIEHACLFLPVQEAVQPQQEIPSEGALVSKLAAAMKAAKRAR